MIDHEILFEHGFFWEFVSWMSPWKDFQASVFKIWSLLHNVYAAKGEWGGAVSWSTHSWRQEQPCVDLWKNRGPNLTVWMTPNPDGNLQATPSLKDSMGLIVRRK